MQVNKILAAAILCALGTSAYAQSSNVTVFGFVEEQVGRAPGDATTKMFDAAGSRLGFKGSEDLGGGNSAEFYMEHRLAADTGMQNAINANGTPGPFWKGGSWVGLSSKTAGSVKLGRWWSQSFLKAQYAQDPFGYGTLGQGVNFPGQACNDGASVGGAGTGCMGAFWLNNSVSYENAVGPVSFGVQYGVEELGTDLKHPVNVGVSYGAGPLYIGLGYEAYNDGDKDQNWGSFALNYDFGVAKLYAGYSSGKDDNSVKVSNAVVGFSAPVGSGAVIGSYNQGKFDSTTVHNLAAVGYKYNLSKRTNVFAVVANDNKLTDHKSGYAVGMFHAF
jgi:predicted porin